MRYLLLSLALAGSSLLAPAQTTGSAAPTAPAAKGVGQLTGRVLDAAGQPVAFAKVALLRAATGQPVDGTACDEAGRFALGRIAPGSYALHVSFDLG